MEMRIFYYGYISGMPLPSEQDPDRSLSVREILCLAYLLSKVVCVAFGTGETEVFAVKVNIISIAVYIFFGFFDGLFFHIVRKTFLGLVDDLDEVNQRIIDFGHHEKFVRLCKENEERVNKFADFMAVATFLCAASYAISTPVLDYFEGNYGQYPWSLKAECKPALVLGKVPWIFEVIIIQEVLSYLLPGNFKFLTDCIMISLLKIQSLHFTYLSDVLQKIPMTSDSSKNTNLLVWLKIHQNAVIHFQKLVRLFSPLLVLYSMGTITMIAGILIYLVQAETSNLFQSISGSAYMCLSMFQLFLMADATDEVTDVSESIAFDIYSIPWYEMKIKDRNHIRLVMVISNYRVYVEAYKAQSFRMNRETYLKIFMSTVSAYIGLQKLIKMNDAGFVQE